MFHSCWNKSDGSLNMSQVVNSLCLHCFSKVLGQIWNVLLTSCNNLSELPDLLQGCFKYQYSLVLSTPWPSGYDNLVDRLTDWLQVVRFVRVNICKYVKIDKKEREKEMRVVEKCNSFTVKNTNLKLKLARQLRVNTDLGKISC